VAFAISRGTTWIDWVGPQAVFQTWRYDPVQKKHGPVFKLFTVAEKLEAVDNLVPDYTFETAPPARVAVVPAQWGSEALLDWLRKVSETADVTMSVCTGARHLAKAGLLNGKTATTHHEAIDEFTEKYPEVHWVRGVRFVEGAKVSTAGGLTAGIDLALRVTERYFGRERAQEVADHLEYQSKGWMV
jgi:transcriptional regulator GlxA family with amidase domain